MKMIQFFILFLYLLISSAFAFTYKYEGVHDQYFNQSIFRVTKVLAELKFHPVFQFYNGDIPIVLADQVYERIDSPIQIFLKVGLVVNKDLHYSQIKLGDFYVLHFENIAMAIFGASETSANKIKSLIENEFKSISLSKLLSFDAYADSSCTNNLERRELSKIDTFSEKISLYNYASEFSSCALQGIKESIESKFQVENFFNVFSLNPTKLWEGVKKNYEDFKSISKIFSSEFHNFVSSLRLNFLPEELLGISCILGKELGPSIPTLIAGPGMALSFAKILATILPKFSKFMNFLSKLKKHPHSNSLVKEELRCGI